MTYAFRIRFRSGKTCHITSEETELVFANEAEHGEDVVLKVPQALAPEPGEEGPPAVTFNQASDLVLVGKPYESEQAATDAAERWLGLVQKAFARHKIGADFGDRAPKGMWFQAALDDMAEGAGGPVLNDVHGVMVFPCEPWPVAFAGTGATVKVGKPAERVVEAVAAAAQLGLTMSPTQRLAYDLFSASFSETTADARFTMLMMALETLIEQEPRAAEAITHVERLIAETSASDLPHAEADSIVGALKALRKESIGQAGRRLAASLGNRTYMEETPGTFFTRCYSLRSDLVHGAYPRPDPGDVGTRAAHLEMFVGHLLSLELLDAVPD